jgi:hypothetical protein
MDFLTELLRITISGVVAIALFRLLFSTQIFFNISSALNS